MIVAAALDTLVHQKPSERKRLLRARQVMRRRDRDRLPAKIIAGACVCGETMLAHALLRGKRRGTASGKCAEYFERGT